MNAAYARAVVARWIAELFAPPDAESFSRVREARVVEEVLVAARTIGLAGNLVRRTLDSMPSWDVWAVQHDLLFGHSVRGACPPYEVEYARGMVFQQVDALADIAAFYHAFGLTIADTGHERPDHFVSQWEFLSQCALKESLAAGECGSGLNDSQVTQDAELCREAQRRFLTDHAAAWMPGFLARVRKNEASGFFFEAATLAVAALDCWCSAFGVQMGSPWLELRPVEEEDWKLECGGDRSAIPAELGPRLSAAMEGGTVHEAAD